MNIENHTKEYHYKTLYTNKMSNKDISDFVAVKNEVFNRSFTSKDFEVKYQSNPFGDSIIILVYMDEECVACRAFWRNDLKKDGKFIEAYQPCDTGVVRTHRGSGIFTKMTKLAMSKLDNSVPLYNFPNDNSIKGYYKMDWKLISHLKYTIFQKKKHINNLEVLDKNYINWLSKSVQVQKEQKLFYMKKNGDYFLLRKRSNNIYIVIAIISADDIENISLYRIKFPICLIFSEQGKFGRGLTTVGRNLTPNDNIPFHKLDTLF